MKKLLFSVIAFALITTSCNKYKDDFKALNARIDALAATVAGVPALTTSIAAIQATLAAIQTSTNQIPGLATSLTALAAQVTAVQTSLTTLAANVATQANLNSLFAQLNTTLAANQTALLTAISGIGTQLAAAITSINGNTNTAVANAVTALNQAILDAQANINTTTGAAIDAAVTQLLDAITTATGGTNALIAQLSTDLSDDVALLLNAINANGAGIQNVQDAVDALGLALAVAAAQIQTLLNSNNIFLGNLIITNEAELVFAEGLGAKVRVITGNLTINTTGLTAPGQLDRLKQVTNGDQVAPLTAYIGSVVGDVVLDGGNPIDLAKLVSIGGASGNLTVSGSSHDLSGLLTVKGNYTATSNPVDDALISVGGAMSINYAGGYSYPHLTTVGTPAGASVLTASSAGGGSPASITTFNFPVLTTNNVLNDGFDPNGQLGYGSVTSVNIGASKTLSILAVPVASSIILGETAYTGPLTITTGVVSTIDLSKMVSAVGAISITTATNASSTVDFSNFTGNGANAITVTGPRVLTMPKYLGALAGQLLNSTTVFTANLALYRGPNDLGGLTVLQNLTVGDLRNTLGTGGATVATTLITANVTGSTYGANVNFTNYFALTTVSTTGTPYMRSLTLDATAVTSLTTAGQMDYLTINNCDNLVGMTMGHNFVNNALGNGTTVIITSNASLATLTTSTSNMKELSVIGNGSLTTANFASYVVGQTITSGVVTMRIFSNGMTGTYAPSIFATNTAPVMTQASLSTLKAYATDILSNPVFAGSTLQLGYTAGSESIVLMDADRAAFILAGGSGATSFVNADGDPAGGVGTRIDVLRELGYLN